MKALLTAIQEKKGKLQPFCIRSNNICSLLLVGWGPSGFKKHRGISPEVSTALGL